MPGPVGKAAAVVEGLRALAAGGAGDLDARGTEQARITALVVAPDCERQGVGRRLLREVEAIARQAGAARIEVTSAASREGAQAFYHGCGFADGARHFVKLLGD